MKVHILGAAGWIPGKNETSCIMIETDNKLIFLDAGTGMSNIGKYKDVFEKYDTVYLLLSHYHLDHLIGLIYLDPYVRNKKLRIWGPGKMCYPNTTSEYIHSLLRKEFFSRSIDNFSDDVLICDFPSNIFNIDETQIEVTMQTHSSPSFRITIDKKLVYATDTVFTEKEWSNINGEVLLHECWNYSRENDNKHTSLWQLKKVSSENNFKYIVLIHQNPMWDSNDYEIIEKMTNGTNIVLGEDGMLLDI